MDDQLKKTGETYNFSDQELIRQLVKSRMDQGQEMEFEDAMGYELPPDSQFSVISKPTVTIKYPKITFNTACIRLFEEVLFVHTPINRTKKRLLIVPCKEEESSALQWARFRKADGVKVNRDITSEEYTTKIFKLMGWNLNCRYRICGTMVMVKPKMVPALRFDLADAVMFDSKPIEIVDKETGEVKKKQVKYYPEEYRDCIGKSYNDYIQTRQMNLFEFLDDYTGKSYSDLPEDSSAETDAAVAEDANDTETI